MATDNVMARFLFAILKQKDLKDVSFVLPIQKPSRMQAYMSPYSDRKLTFELDQLGASGS